MSPAFAFQFIAGKYEGGIYSVPDNRDLLIGRGADLDIVLVEDMVSRRHASLQTHGGRLKLTDLNSTNGTYVNGERITECVLDVQDRVLIGTSILRVTSAAQVEALLETHPALDLTRLEGKPNEGSLSELPVMDVVRLYMGRRRTGLLHFESNQERAELVFIDGVLTHAGVAGNEGLSATDALVHVMGYREGQFAFLEPAEGFERPASFEGDTEALLKAAILQRGQVDALVAAGWPSAARVRLTAPQPRPWSQANFSAPLLDSLQLALVHERIDAIVANAPRGALATLQALEALRDGGYLKREL